MMGDYPPEPLNAWQLEELSERLQIAQQTQQEVTLSTYEGIWIHEAGQIEQIDLQQKIVSLKAASDIIRVPLHTIYRLTFK